MAVSPASVIHLDRCPDIDHWAQGSRAGQTLDSLRGSLPRSAVLLPVHWRSKETGAVIELSTQGVLPDTTFLRLIVEPGPGYQMAIPFSQYQVNGFPIQRPGYDWNRGQWVRWSIHVTDRQVLYCMAPHDQLRDVYVAGAPLMNVPTPWTLKGLVIGAQDPYGPLLVAEVRVWDGLLFESLEDQLELLGNQRLDGRETQLIRYWMMDEGEGEGESSRVWDASRFGDHGFNGGGWRDAQSSGLAFEDGLRRVRQRLETLHSLSRSVWSQKDAVAGREQMLALLGTRLDELKGDRMHLQDRLERLPAKQEDEISELQQEFQLWQQRINDGHKVGLDHFSQTLAQEVEQASEDLRSSKSAYQLQSAAFEVKMLPVQRADDETFLVTFPLPEDTSVQPGQLSTLNLAFEPRPPSPARTELEVPNVLGYTEIVARRLLAKAGFQVELIDQTTDEPGKADRVIDQVPKGGTRTGPEQSLHQPVLVFMGRPGGPAG